MEVISSSLHTTLLFSAGVGSKHWAGKKRAMTIYSVTLSEAEQKPSSKKNQITTYHKCVLEVGRAACLVSKRPWQQRPPCSQQHRDIHLAAKTGWVTESIIIVIRCIYKSKKRFLRGYSYITLNIWKRTSESTSFSSVVSLQQDGGTAGSRHYLFLFFYCLLSRQPSICGIWNKGSFLYKINW